MSISAFIPRQDSIRLITPLSHTLRLVNGYPSYMAKVLFKLLPLHWDSKQVSLWRPLRGESQFQFLTGFWFSGLKPCWFSVRPYGSLYSWFRAGVCGAQTSHSLERRCVCMISLPVVGGYPAGEGPDKTECMLLLHISMWLLLLVLGFGIAVMPVFKYFSEKVALHVIVVWLCQCVAISSGFLYTAILNLPSNNLYFWIFGFISLCKILYHVFNFILYTYFFFFISIVERLAFNSFLERYI